MQRRQNAVSGREPAMAPEVKCRIRKTNLDRQLALVAPCTVAASFWWFGHMNGAWQEPWNLWTGILLVKTVIEVIASHYAVFYILVACSYCKPARQANRLKAVPTGRVAVGYFCCDDLDQEALESIVKYCGGPAIPIFIHDDSSNTRNMRHVDDTAARLENYYDCGVQVVRRADRSGGKPGAVNNLVDATCNKFTYLLICDSDSFFYAGDALMRGLAYFQDENVGIVQFRTVGHIAHADSTAYSSLSESITFYDTFVAFMDKFGWSPFLGHNALLRLDTFTKVGGFTPGQLADDIDYSVRVRMYGYTVRYGRDIIAGERHPQSYQALRRRTFKWSYGCTQILLDSGWKVLTCAHISLTEKITFFLTVGYYHFQVLLLVYLAIFYLVFPFVTPPMEGVFNLVFSAGIILLLTFLPSLSYFVHAQRFVSWIPIVTIWGFVYGSQDFVMLRAISSSLAGRRLEWIPTNLETGKQRHLDFLPELIFGSLIVSVALLQQPLLLVLPTTILFAGKNLIAPFLQRAVFSS